MPSFSSSLVRGLLSLCHLICRTSKNGAGLHVENEAATVSFTVCLRYQLLYSLSDRCSGNGQVCNLGVSLYFKKLPNDRSCIHIAQNTPNLSWCNDSLWIGVDFFADP
jgi:hypothetical protein